MISSHGAKVRIFRDIGKYFLFFLSETFAVSDFYINFAPALVLRTTKCARPDGGIGRRAGLKHQWGNPCRFDPGSGYSLSTKLTVSEQSEMLQINRLQHFFFS